MSAPAPLSRMSGDWPLSQQQSRKLSPALPGTGEGNGDIQERKIATEIRLNSFLNPKPFEPRTKSLQPRKLQIISFHRPGGMAPACSLSERNQWALSARAICPDIALLEGQAFSVRAPHRSEVGFRGLRRPNSIPLEFFGLTLPLMDAPRSHHTAARCLEISSASFQPARPIRRVTTPLR